MSLSVGERILVPGTGALLFAAMSWGFMSAVGGATSRMKAFAVCASVFMTGFGYAVFWQDKLASATGWAHTWLAVVGSFGLLSLWLYRPLRDKNSRMSGEGHL